MNAIPDLTSNLDLTPLLSPLLQTETTINKNGVSKRGVACGEGR
jgi:hypothetical protein